MSWRIRHQYGHGAANVELAAEPHFVAHRSLSMTGALMDAGGDFYLSTLPPLLLAAFMITALFVTVSQDKGYTDLEVVMVTDDPFETIPEPEPEPVAEPEPEPEPVKVVEKKPEPPPPVKKAVEKPKPPPIQKIAKVKPKPPPVARVKPKPRPKAKPKPKPVIKPQMEALAMRPEPKPAPAPARRGNRVREQVAKPKLDLAPIANAPKLANQPDERARRFAAVRAPTASRRPKADLGPPIAARSLSAPAPEPAPARTRRAAPKTTSEKRQMAKVSFAASSAPTPAAMAETNSRARSRPVAKPDRNRRAAPPPMEMAAVAPTGSRTSSTAAPRRTERGRTERNSSTRNRADHTGSRGLRGVPLASLAACVSEREEEALKRKLVAAVTTQRECVSRAGTYRFVETKNLNAFLMTIERSASRAETDRCGELEYALECVSR